MKVAITFEFTEEDRRNIAMAEHNVYGYPIPRGGLATRKQLLGWIDNAIGNQLVRAADNSQEQD
jgi:hypothetical protein